MTSPLAPLSPLFSTCAPSPIGSIRLLASEKGLISIAQSHAAEVPDETIFPNNPALLDPYLRAIEQYFAGKRGSFDGLALDMRGGTPFQQRVWMQIATVPYGSTISYSELARRANSEKAVRAVASACGQNPMPFFIPCHRIIGKNGSLGGFSWGLDLKRALLALESGSAEAQAFKGSRAA